jgi:alkaline ceramidase
MALPHAQTYALLGLIGVGSMYFHATLSFAGQTLDEWGIIWVVAFCFYAYLPQDYMQYVSHVNLALEWFEFGYVF